MIHNEKSFCRWLDRQLSEEIPESIEAFHINIHESPFSIELFGSSEFTAHDDRWVYNEDWSPKTRQIEVSSELYGESWQQAEELIIEWATNYLKSNAKNKLKILSRECLSVGFVDYKLNIVHTPPSFKGITGSNVFERTSTEDKEINARFYNFIIGAVLCWGFGVNWWMVTHISAQAINSFGPWMLLISYFVSCTLGVVLFGLSSNPIVSFIGYNLVVLPFGLIINIVVSGYDPFLVQDAIKVTGLVTGIMMLLGTIYPAFFKEISGALKIALIAVIVIELLQIFILKTHQGWLDWIVALIFCGYIGFDWGRANQIPKTVDNAIDSAAALYIDIINLFLRILQIMGRNRSS